MSEPGKTARAARVAKISKLKTGPGSISAPLYPFLCGARECDGWTRGFTNVKDNRLRRSVPVRRISFATMTIG